MLESNCILQQVINSSSLESTSRLFSEYPIVMVLFFSALISKYVRSVTKECNPLMFFFLNPVTYRGLLQKEAKFVSILLSINQIDLRIYIYIYI
jgi:hypothetical protein